MAIVDALDGQLRDFPWRRTRDPWVILVSEVLLQQTQAPRVAARFDEVLLHFGTPARTAALGRVGVLQHWRGFGYNRRAIRLHEAAVVVAGDLGGVVPSDEAALRSLPGVGRYTAAAVQTFAFGHDVAVYDTNVARVLSRAGFGRPLSSAEGWRAAEAMVPTGDGWRFNQSVLDFGATICTARTPSCATCPLRRRCIWLRVGGEDPARATAGAARPQGAFNGSRRQARGAVVEHLRGGGASAAELANALGTLRQFEAALASLVADGTVVHRRGSYTLG